MCRSAGVVGNGHRITVVTAALRMTELAASWKMYAALVRSEVISGTTQTCFQPPAVCGGPTSGSKSRRFGSTDLERRFVPAEGVIGQNGHRNLSRRCQRLKLKLTRVGRIVGCRRVAKWRLIAHRQTLAMLLAGLCLWAIGRMRSTTAARTAVTSTAAYWT
jgi:hypothetical protein